MDSLRLPPDFASHPPFDPPRTQRLIDPGPIERWGTVAVPRLCSRTSRVGPIPDPNDVSRAPFVSSRVGYWREKDKPMLVGLKRISTALGLLAGFAATTQAQGVASSPNQATANAVASALRASQALSGYRIEIETRNGVVTLTGTVATAEQKAEAIGRTQVVPGVNAVADRLTVSSDPRVQPAQFQRLALGGLHGGMGGMSGGGMVGGGDIIYDGSAGAMAGGAGVVAD